MAKLEPIFKANGEEIGASNDEVQSALLNGFAKMLELTCGPLNLDNQLCFISIKLTPATRRVLARLVEFNDAQNDQEKRHG